jgi:SPX domain protein involved in polyphosphate accumulation
MRLERKFTAWSEQGEFARAWLHQVCLPDPLYPVGKIFSIYYDTPDLAAYYEKANGDFLKTKVRLRWYDSSLNDSANGIPAFLEIKMKKGSGGDKFRKKLSLPWDWLNRVTLENEDLNQIVHDHVHELGEKVPLNLFAMLRVVYSRERFVCSSTGARVSLDTQIRSDIANNDFLPTIGIVDLDHIVLEIKDDHEKEIPWLKNLFQSGFRSRSLSKYGMCMHKILHGVH